MLAFFRKIRQKLLNENLPEHFHSSRAGKFNKYLLYAIGEIVLVVIGILIALQINTWNENRLNKNEEQRILTAISEELKLRKFLFEEGKSLQENKIVAAKSLLKEIQVRRDSPNYDSMDHDIDRLTKRWLSGTQTSIYDALIGSGDLKLLSSEMLRNELVQLKSDQEFLELFEEIQLKFEDEQLSPFLNKYINRSAIRSWENNRSGISDIPVMPFKSSRDSLLEKMEFANLLVELIEHTYKVLSTYERLGEKVARVDSLATSGIREAEDYPTPKMDE